MISNKKVACQDLMNYQQQQKGRVIAMIKRSTMKMLEIGVELRALSSARDAADCSFLPNGSFIPRDNAPRCSVG
jgi:hypothetical protein